MYDEVGNPRTIGSKELSWLGRQLTQITDGEEEISYAYNGDGQRVSKTVNGTTTEFIYNGDILAGQKTGDDISYLCMITTAIRLVLSATARNITT